MDDIIIYSDDEESHLEHVKDVLRRVREFGLKISAEKTHLFKAEVKYLGHIISREGNRMDPEKVRVLKEYPLPQNVAQLHSFVSTVGFYKNFFGKRFTDLAKPLREMVQRGSVQWDKNKLECFQKIRDMVAEERFLKPPDWNKKFFLETDASGYAIGGCCYQYDAEGRKRPIMWMGKKLTSSEANYCTRDQELLAVLYCIERARMFLYGRKFTVRSDHLNLLWLYENDVSGRIARWAAKLSAYDFKIEHIKGKDNIVADGISRIRYRSTAAVLIAGLAPNTKEATEKTRQRLLVASDQKSWIPSETPESIRTELDDFEWHHSMHQDSISRAAEERRRQESLEKDKKERGRETKKLKKQRQKDPRTQKEPRGKNEVKTLQEVREDIKKQWVETQKRDSTRTRGISSGGGTSTQTGTRT
jgi:hypothetical protein